MQGFDSCALGGIVTHQARTVTSAMTEQPMPLVSKLEPETVDGVRYVRGQIQASVKTTFQDSVDSCKFTTSGIAPCSFTGPATTIDGNVVFYVDFQPWTNATVSLRGSWFVPGAEMGVASGSYETACLFPLPPVHVAA